MKNMMTFGIYGKLAPASTAPVAKPDIITYEEVAQENTTVTDAGADAPAKISK